MRKRTSTVGLVSMMAVLLLGACAPASPGQPGGSNGAEQPPAQRKVLTLAANRELLTFADFVGYGTSGGGNRTVRYIAHDYLVAEDEVRDVHPQLAIEVPSVEKGTWRVNADGTMDTVWKIPANVKWHDGAPFTADDLVFAEQLHTDPAFTLSSNGGVIRLMESATALDAQTLSVHWAKTTPLANKAYGLDPMPKHLLFDAYQNDKDAFIKSPMFYSEWVGLGPYRLTRWDAGVELEFTRFDDYYAGRPPLDTIVVRYMKDGNTMVANILAGSVDVVLAPSVDLEGAADVRRRWAGTGNQVLPQVTDRLRWIRPQMRQELVQIKNGMTNLTVRRALSHSVDRQTLADVVGQGFAPVADSWVRPNEPARPQMESGIQKYPYDPTRAQQLLAEAGWTRGADGALVHQSGERFESVLSVRPTTGADKDAAIIADGWKALGLQIGMYFIPPAQADDRQVLSTQPFANLSSNGAAGFWDDILHSKGIASEANRWNGANNHGYSNPALDATLDRLTVAIDDRERVELSRQAVQEAMTDAAVIPMYWQTDPLFLLAGVRDFTWRTFDWKKD
jgi:peptide/nickel transport system substrate-binding protein